MRAAMLALMVLLAGCATIQRHPAVLAVGAELIVAGVALSANAGSHEHVDLRRSPGPPAIPER